MRLSELDYELPSELVAQYPLPQRVQARLMVLERGSDTIAHSRFYKLPGELREGDLLVLNDTRVIPARLMARKESGGGVELLLVRPVENVPRQWYALVRTHRPLRAGTRLLLKEGGALTIVAQCRPGRVLLESADSTSIEDILAKAGAPALPHYIRRAVLVLDGVFRNPNFTRAYDAAHFETRGPSGMVPANRLNVPPPLDTLARLRVVANGIIAVDVVLGLEITNCGGAPMMI